MIIRKCDCCGQEITTYVQVQTTICATNDYTNVSDMLHLQKKLDLCKSCAEKVFENIQLRDYLEREMNANYRAVVEDYYERACAVSKVVMKEDE